MEATWHSVPHATASAYSVWWGDEDEPTLGVREPRVPIYPSLSGGAAAELHFEAEHEAEARSQGASLT